MSVATEDLESKFLTDLKFYRMVEDEVLKNKVSYIEATISKCESLGIDYEDLSKNNLILPILRQKLLREGEESGQLKRTTTFSLDDL